MIRKPLLSSLICICCLGVYGCDSSSGNLTVDPDKVENNEDPSKDSEKTCEDDPSRCEAVTCEGADLTNDRDNCGTCGNSCGEHGLCIDGVCSCEDGYADCDKDGICETTGACECVLGEERSCYWGPEGTENVGTCHGGVQKCSCFELGCAWNLECEGSVLPSYTYTCQAGNPAFDQDCNGVPDSQQDEDQDGYAICSEAGEKLDCCDNVDMCASNDANLVHPGNTVDCMGNGIDDDCDGQIDEDTSVDCFAPVVDTSCKITNRSCSAVGEYNHPDSNGVTHVESTVYFSNYLDQSSAQPTEALSLLKAMDMCMDGVTAESNQPGIIEYSVSGSPDGSKLVGGRQINVLDGMKDKTGQVTIAPRVGTTFAVLSSGDAQDVYRGSSNDHQIIVGKYLGNETSLPSVYANHHTNIVTHPACATIINLSTINDMAHLHVKLRAPETAKGFSFDFRFFTREYPNSVCSNANDAMIVLLTDENGRPLADINGNGDLSDEDANIAFDSIGNPISVNSAFFTACADIPCGYVYSPTNEQCPLSMSCSAETNKCNTCPDGVGELGGVFSVPFTGSKIDYAMGGGTGWLTTQAPVNPGQVFNLDFYIWDTQDQMYDSTMILDNFQWLCGETTTNTGFAVPVEQIN